MNYSLSIEPYIERNKDDNCSLDFNILDRVWDKETHIVVRKMRIDKQLYVGHLYEFCYETDLDVDTYVYLVVKAEDDNIYYLVEYYNGKVYTIEEDYLCEAITRGSTKELFDIDTSKIGLKSNKPVNNCNCENKVAVEKS